MPRTHPETLKTDRVKPGPARIPGRGLSWASGRRAARCTCLAALVIALVSGRTGAAEPIARAGGVLPYGIVQFGFGSMHDPDVDQFLHRCHVNLWEEAAWTPMCLAVGWGDRASFDAAMQKAIGQVRRGQRDGIAIISYVPYMWIYGDEKTRTHFFDFYDNHWNEYPEYLGTRPPDPIEWAKRDIDGSMMPFSYHDGGSGYWICPNNPYWLQYLNGCLKALAEAGFNGVRYDGPTTACWCRFCQEAFRKWLQTTYSSEELVQRFGIDVASVTIPIWSTDPLQFLWKQYRDFRMGETVAETAATVHKYNPRFIMSYNCYIGGGRVSSENEYLSAASDYALVEGDNDATAHSLDGRKHSVSSECKYLIASGNGKPTDLHYYLYWCGGEALKSMSLWSREQVEANALFYQAAIAEGMSNGCPYPIISQQVHSNAQQAIIDYADFFYRCQSYLADARTYANVTVLASVSQTFAALPSYPLSVSRFLADQHVPHTMIIERELTTQRLGEYDVLVLPETQLLSDDHARVISDFVMSGRGLVVLGPAGIRDGYNQERAASNLAPLLGIPGREFPNSPFRREAGRGRVAWFPSVKLPPNGRWPLPAESLQLLNGLAEALDWAAGNGFSGYLNAPEMVELSLMRSPDGRMLFAHLMNYNVQAPTRVTTYENIRLAVTLPEGADVERVLLFSPDLPKEQTQLEPSVVEWRGRRLLVVTVPRIEIYDLVAIVLKGAKLAAMPPDAPIPVTLSISGEPRAAPGQKLALRITVANRGEVDVEHARLELTVPQGSEASVTTTATLAGVPAGTEKHTDFELQVPDKAEPGTHRDADLAAEVKLSTGQTATLTTRHRVLVVAPL